MTTNRKSEKRKSFQKKKSKSVAVENSHSDKKKHKDGVPLLGRLVESSTVQKEELKRKEEEVVRSR